MVAQLPSAALWRSWGPSLILRGCRTVCHRPRQLSAPSARRSPRSGGNDSREHGPAGFPPGSEGLERGAAFTPPSLWGEGAVTGEDSRGALAGGDAERRGRRGRSLRGARCRRPAAGRVSVRDEQRGFRVGRIDRQMPRTPRPRSLQTSRATSRGWPFFLFQPTAGPGSSLSQGRPQTHLVWSPAPATLRIWLCLHRCCSLCFILNPHVGKIHLDTAYWTRSPKMH